VRFWAANFLAPAARTAATWDFSTKLGRGVKGFSKARRPRPKTRRAKPGEKGRLEGSSASRAGTPSVPLSLAAQNRRAIAKRRVRPAPLELGGFVEPRLIAAPRSSSPLLMPPVSPGPAAVFRAGFIVGFPLVLVLLLPCSPLGKYVLSPPKCSDPVFRPLNRPILPSL